MRSLLLICVLLTLMGPKILLAEPSSGADNKPLAAKPTMQKYAENMSILLKNLRAFDNHPSLEQKQTVLQSLALLKGLSHDVRPTLELYGLDPVMHYLSIDLTRQFDKIEATYVNGSYPVARYLLRQTTQYCVGCHAASPIKTSAVVLFKEPPVQMSDLERAEYFGATRRHEEAMIAYEHFLSNRMTKISEPELWEKAIENLLAITIRLRQDASITLEMISARIDEGGYAPKQWELLQAWRASAKAWTQDATGKRFSGQRALEKSRQLYDNGQKISERGLNHGYVEFMRAASLLNEICLSDSNDDLKAQAYLLTGQVSENLRDVVLWMRPDAYYEACIRLKPHSKIAQDCSRQWLSYSKTIASDAQDQEKLRQLSELAH